MMRGYGVAEKVRRVLRDGLDGVEAEFERVVEEFREGRVGLNEYLRARMRVELMRERVVENNLRRLLATRRRAEPSQGNP